MNNLIKQPDRRSSERTEISWDEYYKTRKLPPSDIYPDVMSPADETDEYFNELLSHVKVLTVAFIILLATYGFAIWAYP